MAVKTVKHLARLRKYSEGGNLETITNCEDNTRATYAIDYLPDYAELRFELIRTYQLAERRREEMNKKGGKKGHPSFPIMDGHAQPGAAMMSCYRCGIKGIALGIHPARAKKGRFIKMPRNGSGSKTEHEPKGEKAKAKGKERLAVKETAMPNLYATTGARGMVIAAMRQRATFRTTVRKEETKEKGKKDQQRYRPRPSRGPRKKSWQW
jgi:hypothetical protein